MKITNIVGAVFGTVFKVAVAAAVVILIYKGAMAGYDFGYRIFEQEPMATGEGRTVTVAITEDMSAIEMGQMLKEKGLIEDTRLFFAQYYLSEFQKDIQPGIYELSTSMTVEEMMEIMAAGTEEGDDDSQ